MNRCQRLPGKRLSMDWYSNTGRSKLIRELMAKGLSVRKAEKAVNAVFGCMTRALYRGEIVEIPGGCIQAVGRNSRPRQKLQRFRNVQTGKAMYRIVRFRGPHRVVRFRPDMQLDMSPLPAPPPEPTPEQIEIQQLASELFEKPVNEALLARLQEAVEVHPHKPGALLRRLRELKARGYRYFNIRMMAGDISALYWI